MVGATTSCSSAEVGDVRRRTGAGVLAVRLLMNKDSYSWAHASDDLWIIDRYLAGPYQQTARDAWVRVHNFIVEKLNEPNAAQQVGAPRPELDAGHVASAPAVAAPLNQCDGCRRGLKLEDGKHYETRESLTYP